MSQRPDSSAPMESKPLRTEGKELAKGTLVGRDRELRELKAGLEAAISGRGRLCLLAGEPGIGKTRLATEIATEASLREAEVLWGRCWEGGGAPPIFRGYRSSEATRKRLEEDPEAEPKVVELLARAANELKRT